MVDPLSPKILVIGFEVSFPSNKMLKDKIFTDFFVMKSFFLNLKSKISKMIYNIDLNTFPSIKKAVKV